MAGIRSKATITGSLPLEAALVKDASGAVIASPVFADCTYDSASGQWICDTPAPAGTYVAGAQLMRLKGSNPPVTASSLVAVTVTSSATPAPTITSFAPTSGAQGSTVVIVGTNFTGATQVSVNSAAVANFVVNSATQITATLTSSQATGKVRVTTPGGTAVSTASFTVTTSTRPPAPANTQVDDTNNTFAGDLVGGNAAVAAYEYTTDGGVSYTNGAATGSALTIASTRLSLAVGNIYKAPGQVGFRLAAAGSVSAGDTAFNQVAFTVAAAPTNGVNIVCHGNSITAGATVGASDSWPSKLAARLGSGYTVINSGNNGHNLSDMVSELPSLVFANYNPNAAFNILFVQEQVNSLRAGMNALDYYNLLLQYALQVKNKTGQSWIIVPITGTPTTVTPGGTDTNDISKPITVQMLQAAPSGGLTCSWTANHVLNLGANRRIGAFGTTAYGQDAGYSSFSTVYYTDGTHPTERGYEIIAHMAYDMVEYIVNGIAIPDQSYYPDQAAVGTPVTFQDVNPNNTVSGSGVSNIFCNGGQFSGARTVEALTRGGGAANEYRGSFFAKLNGGAPGFFGVGRNGVTSQFQWIELGNYLHGNDNRVFSNGNSVANLNAAAAVNGTLVEIQVYGDARVDILYDGQLQGSYGPGAIGFPCCGNFAIEANAGFNDVRVVIAP